MAVTVLPVDTTSYSSSAFDDIFEAMSIQGDAATQGVVRGKLNVLAVTGAGSPISVDTGWAIVNGKLVKNSAAVSLNVATPATHPRIDRAVIRIDYTASPVSASIALLAGTEAAVPAAPALTQTDGTTWELSLAQVAITTGGVITLTDERRYLGHGHVDVNSFVAGALAASATGRAVMAAGLFDAATVLDKFGADSFTNAVLLQLIQDGAFQADAATRALFADGLWSTAKMSDGAKRLIGEIVMWSGSIGGTDGHRPVVSGAANESWHICNGDLVGAVQTPDLRNRFVVGAGDTYAVAATGGSTTASHLHGAGTLAGPSHTHSIPLANIYPVPADAAQKINNNTGAGGTEPVTGNTAASAPAILPPYYGLYYIMKVS